MSHNGPEVEQTQCPSRVRSVSDLLPSLAELLTQLPEEATSANRDARALVAAAMDATTVDELDQKLLSLSTVWRQE